MNVGPGRWRLTWSCSGGVILLQLSFIQLEDHILLNRPIPRGSVAYTDVTLKDATKCTQRVHTSRHIGAHTQVRSHTSVLGKVARGSLPVRMSWPGISGNTPASNPSSARTATAASLARTTLPCTESVTCWSECVIAHNVIQTRCKLFTVFLTKIQLGRIVQQMNTFQYQKHKQNLFVKCRSRGSQQGCLYISAQHSPLRCLICPLKLPEFPLIISLLRSCQRDSLFAVDCCSSPRTSLKLHLI